MSGVQQLLLRFPLLRMKSISALHRCGISSVSSSSFGDLGSNGDDAASPRNPNKEEDEQLLSRILRLGLPKHSATTVLQNWVEEGNTLSIPHLRLLSNHLTTRQRYKHALEISEWMITQEKHGLSDSDHGLRLHLIGKVFGISTAERYFESSSCGIKCSETYTALLHLYGTASLTEKAEELYDQASRLDEPLAVIFYNEMMTLHVSAGQYEKVGVVMEELGRRGLSPDLFSYNQWVSSCAAAGDMDAVRRVIDGPSRDRRFGSDESWGRYALLVGVYMEAGRVAGSPESSSWNEGAQMSFDLLMILHASTGKRAVVEELWAGACGRKVGVNYGCGLLCFVMLGEMKAAEQVAAEWRRLHSASLGRLGGIVGALSGRGWVEEAEALRRLLCVD